MVLPPLDFESSASAISPPRLKVSTDKIITNNGLIKKNRKRSRNAEIGNWKLDVRLSCFFISHPKAGLCPQPKIFNHETH